VLPSASTTSYRVPRTDRLPSSGSVGRTDNCRAVDGGRGRFLPSTTGRRPLPPSQDHSTASSCRRRRFVPGRSTRIVNRHPSTNCTATSVNHVDHVPTSVGTVGLYHNAVAVVSRSLTPIAIAGQLYFASSVVGPLDDRRPWCCRTVLRVCRSLSDRTASDADRLLPTPSCCAENCLSRLS